MHIYRYIYSMYTMSVVVLFTPAKPMQDPFATPDRSPGALASLAPHPEAFGGRAYFGHQISFS